MYGVNDWRRHSRLTLFLVQVVSALLQQMERLIDHELAQVHVCALIARIVRGHPGLPRAPQGAECNGLTAALYKSMAAHPGSSQVHAHVRPHLRSFAARFPTFILEQARHALSHLANPLAATIHLFRAYVNDIARWRSMPKTE